ncbi:MAG: cupin domain-containing protein [Rhodospirillales bacterium]|jgi:uncharacterized cupin superfamily protein|nr:cupin domain-containing protein [Rhodospirillales bacterium]
MTELTEPALDPMTLDSRVGFDFFYPVPLNEPCSKREWREMGKAVGLTQFGVNLTTLPPGTWSTQRHWHLNEDEFVYIVSGEAVLVTDSGEQLLSAGMVAGFPAGKQDGHHLINKSDSPVTLIEVGSCAPREEGGYPDLGKKFIVHEDGSEDFLPE